METVFQSAIKVHYKLLIVKLV